ncbi:hypothetical protein CSKR_203412 [Clonorchis sinensis]|uniref:Uncharacterized protein n=2 Tax=Clonorchis sinensis TaxID=79923 RepID=A0A8T1MBG4_CLOSI|nr:hypothetical protein CSKR_203412 [Clonorchis sinensis]GAA47293.1 hypothetical protein CLF_100183 [Clonorchis sinensis]
MTSSHDVICCQPDGLRKLNYEDGPRETAKVHKEIKEKSKKLRKQPKEDSRLITEEYNVVQRNTSQARSDTESSSSDDSSDEDDESSPASSGDTTSDSGTKDIPVKESGLRCCLLCACSECCVRRNCPERWDKLYYLLQKQSQHCPNGCPTIVPRPEEEDWKQPGGHGSKYACCSFCGHPGCIICLKYTDCLLCPIFPVWECCKGIDDGYRRYRIQLRLHRYRDSHKKRYLVLV